MYYIEFSLLPLLFVSAVAFGPPNSLELKRGLPDAPDGYTPKSVSCPSTRPSVRDALTLSSEEVAWLKVRRPNTVAPMRDLLGRLGITGFDAASYIDKHKSNTTALPNIAIAASGGGYRALMNGAGALAAFDSRTSNSTSAGQLGGVLQSATYLAGLSGGNWLVGSIYSNNFTTVEDIVDGNEGSTWDFSNSIFEGPQGTVQVFSSAEYYHQLYDQVKAKQDAGYNVTVTDFWGRALAYQLINAPDGGPAYTWSSLADNDFIKQGTAPLPIVICDSRAPGTKVVPINGTIFEFTPWEFGSFDPTVFGFVPMEYVGSRFSGGKLPSDEHCVRGYDSASFVMGTSSTLFNQFALQFSSTSPSLPGFATKFIEYLLHGFSKSEDDIAEWLNPFYKYNSDTNPFSETEQLTLVDGGEDLENIPFHPLIQPVREVDAIIAIDSSADTDFYWPNGTSLVATYQRSLSGLQNNTAFPPIPDQNTIVNLGLNTRPTFFGCNGTNGTIATATRPAPLIIYLPNAPYTADSNVSTFDPSYETSERNEIITNGYNVATRGNASTDNWPACLGCALIRRSLERTGTDFPAACAKCFDQYCWDGSLNSTKPANYDPKAYIGIKSGAPGAVVPAFGAVVSLAALAAAVAVLL